MIRYGMIGGGPGAFIGAVHRMAATLDGRYQLVAGAFASDPERSRAAGIDLGIAPERSYGSFTEMAEAEALLPPDTRVQAVVVVTPNHLHYPTVRKFLERGMHVVCDKPFTTKLDDAEELCRLSSTGEAGDSGRARPACAVTYNYSGYPMVREAQALVRRGEVGTVRKVIVEYIQGWLATLLEDPGNSDTGGHKQAEWRADPERGGPSAVLGDIGTHAHHLMRYVTGLEVARIYAQLGTVVPGRHAHDDATVLMELDNGASALLLASQVATGERNHLRIRVYGNRGGLDWRQEEPGRLRLMHPDGSERVLHRGAGTTSPSAEGATRLPGGHPEGFIEALANVYGDFADALEGGEAPLPDSALGPLGEPTEQRFPTEPAYPTARDGTHGVHFVERAVLSAERGCWVDAGYDPP